MTDVLYELDLAFVVDTTGSMGPFIDAARRHMADMLRALTEGPERPVSLRLGVVEYRDHPPQDTSFVARAHPFEMDLMRSAKVIAKLQPNGGGDAPEAVFDGLEAACTKLSWRSHACRVAVLIGDAPPHGVGGAGDHFRNGCPCGLSTERVTALFEEVGVTLYALGLTPSVRQSFSRLASFTGGAYFESDGEQAIEAVRGLLNRELGDIDFDRRVLELVRCTPDWSMDRVAESVGGARQRVAGSLSRLGRRGLLKPDAVLIVANEPPAASQPSGGAIGRAFTTIRGRLFGANKKKKGT